MCLTLLVVLVAGGRHPSEPGIETMLVIAIIVILIAIAIPVFTAQLERAGEATDAANARAAYAEVMAEYITNPSGVEPKTFTLQQGQAGWQNDDIYAGLKNLETTDTKGVTVTVSEKSASVTTGSQGQVSYEDGEVTISFGA